MWPPHASDGQGISAARRRFSGLAAIRACAQWAKEVSGSQVNTDISRLLEQEMGVGKVKIDFTDITDYVILLIYLMRCMVFIKTECKQLIDRYETIIERCRAKLPFDVYSKLIKTNARGKLTAARQFVSNN